MQNKNVCVLRTPKVVCTTHSTLAVEEKHNLLAHVGSTADVIPVQFPLGTYRTVILDFFSVSGAASF